MKRYWIVIVILILLLVFFGMGISDKEKEGSDVMEKRGVFVSYIELNYYLKGKEVGVSKKNIDKMISNIKEFGFNMIILQVRSFSDAIYPSEIFPWSSTVSVNEGEDPGYDVLNYFIKKAHQNGMLIYAWINPYRVRTSEDVSSISSKNPAYKYIGTDTLFVKEGIFYNPAKEEVEDLIVSGVLELVNNYRVDGVLFDDYFYPDENIDVAEYNAFKEDNPNISMDEYHLDVVNRMIKRVHEVCEKKGIDFGVSPDGNISNNYEKLFADVRRWTSSSKYIDFIMPQIYYGFYNETKAFKQVASEWDSLVTDDSVELMVALAFYKVGVVDNYAKSGSLEWITNDDIIMREIIISRNLKNYGGFALFRYDNLFNSSLYTDTSMLEIENTKKILK